MFWDCPKCHSNVDFKQQMSFVFEEDGEASFDVEESGLWFHTIVCENEECNANWIVSISKMNEDSF